MNTILLILCNALSCFIISTILFQFMNGKYKKSSQSRYVYIVIETVTVIFTTCINNSDLHKVGSCGTGY